MSSLTDQDGLLDLEERRSLDQEMEFFEFADAQPVASPSFTTREATVAHSASPAISNTKIITPVQRMLDPIASTFSNISVSFETCISRYGNPLIIKRLLYLFLRLFADIYRF